MKTKDKLITISRTKRKEESITEFHTRIGKELMELYGKLIRFTINERKAQIVYKEYSE